MAVEELSEQHNLIHSTVANLKQSTDTQRCRDISQQIDQIKKQRQEQLDQTQESLQRLSRQLQDTRSRVDASKAQREQKSHMETMRDLDEEKKQTQDLISEEEEKQRELKVQIQELEEQLGRVDERVEEQMLPDEQVLKLQILRGLGVEPLANAQTGLVEKARVWTADSASVINVRGMQEPPHQVAAKLWDLCA
ncbi:hypothetical protein IWW36_000650 [Coemansia brasiliensis]|uniref:Kinetochore protein Spc24 n=1 Tax=Coemansia brasiliensis TaxID=2650707 RepID=A0A9W8IAK7_9FUNG|nr:hypothetical protein IWW36_000650 [Coemansia brasiliensis]